ncbi:nucleotidyltransferase family protein [Allobacillus sp. SKP2-8]|uniref:DUF6036 family nucleotidyltransferase n=1 Tax=unclassified Allobacillus TaxID=2628859 RepID=UPI0011821B67|nr:DUF6036 family nucleotidyltransferase [Allobacillus sp. SKP2-8]TSJ63602.1 nucleotidyltransferase family protein [Allobacillus sp. SKP2-8]
MNSIEKARLQLSTLKGKPKFEKMLQTIAILTKLFEQEKLKPIIVGGLAVEIYTRSEYTTSDIDIIFSQREIADSYLKSLGFIAEGRHWYHEELMISIEIPNDMLEDADYDKVIELQLENNLRVYVIGIEDIILDRLRACVHWKSSSDCEWGKRLYLLHAKRLDMDYLTNTSRADNTLNKLNDWLNGVRK